MAGQILCLAGQLWPAGLHLPAPALDDGDAFCPCPAAIRGGDPPAPHCPGPAWFWPGQEDRLYLRSPGRPAGQTWRWLGHGALHTGGERRSAPIYYIAVFMFPFFWSPGLNLGWFVSSIVKTSDGSEHCWYVVGRVWSELRAMRGCWFV